MTREEAIKKIKWGIAGLIIDKDVRDALETLIPELRENENERIRKEMVDYFSQYKDNGLRGVDITPWIAYLEKQKEQEPKMVVRIPKFRVGDIIQHVPLEEWDRSRRITSVDKDGYYYDTKHLGDNFSGGFIGFSFEDEYELVEQKPTENLSKEEYVKRFKALCDAYEIELPNREYDIYHLCDDLSKLSMESGELKPADWTELQSEFRNINEAFEDGKKEVVDHPEKYGLWKSAEWSDKRKKELGDYLFDMIKLVNTGDKKLQYSIDELEKYVEKCTQDIIDLCPISQQTKQEWSEEDEEALMELLNILSRRELYLSDDSEWLSFKLKNWSKSLRPQWKPSEEQMNAIDYVLRYDKTGEYRDALKSLYDQLYDMYKDV